MDNETKDILLAVISSLTAAILSQNPGDKQSYCNEAIRLVMDYKGNENGLG